MGSSLIQHGMQEMNPLVRVRWGHPQELSWYGLDGMLLYIGQKKEAFVGYGRQGTRVIRTLAADRARLPSNSPVVHVGHKGLLNMRQKRLECLLGSSG
jgi:hypothetical protein